MLFLRCTSNSLYWVIKTHCSGLKLHLLLHIKKEFLISVDRISKEFEQNSLHSLYATYLAQNVQNIEKMFQLLKDVQN